MSYEQIRSFRAAADVSAGFQLAGRITGEHEVGLITNGNAQVPMGIIVNKQDVTGAGVDLQMTGVARARMGGTVTAGQPLSINNTGELISAPFEAAIGTADLYIFAWALEGGANDEVIDVWLTGAPIPGSTE